MAVGLRIIFQLQHALHVHKLRLIRENIVQRRYFPVNIPVISQRHLHLADVQGGLSLGIVGNTVHRNLVERELLGQIQNLLENVPVLHGKRLIEHDLSPSSVVVLGKFRCFHVPALFCDSFLPRFSPYLQKIFYAL